MVWVPGYWAWDTDRKDFIWVSGCWRNAPPNTYWVPGHWLNAGNGWQWIGGFWKPITAQPQQEIEYLPAPPPAIEVAAPGPPPLPNQVWVPGCWYWDQGHYLQRHGYWLTPQVGWVWVPSHLVWTPRGYIFATGHWDHDFDNRGVLFCPTYFPPAVRVRVGFVFSPEVCVDVGMLRLNLFVYPQYHHYYFGDYYDDAYGHRGIVPWYKCETIHTWYDPLFVYDRWHFHQNDPHWAATLAHDYDQRRDHRDMRPARTYEEMRVQMNSLPPNRRPEYAWAEPVKTYAASQHTALKFERINTVERQQIAVKATDVRSLREQRNKWEAPPAQHGSGPVPTANMKTEPAAPEARAVTKEAPPAIKLGRPVQSSAVAPVHDVRVTQPERVTVPTLPRTPQSGETRYIAKQPPGHPAQEQAHPAPNAHSPGHDAGHGAQNRSDSQPAPNRDR
jgi:hypothetical protein